MLRGLALFCALCAPACAAGVAGADKGWDWRETLTPHFRLEHQNTWLPAGLALGVEKVFFRLRMDLESFSPWMSRERVGLYLYRDLDSYLKGEFRPPRWSNGLAIYGRRAVAMPETKDIKQLLRVIAHETTHLLFVGYFRERHADPPFWINEGLAMNEESDAPSRPETSPWYQAMIRLKPSDWYPMAQFFSIAPDRDLGGNQGNVGRWYIQAYSVTHFLLRGHSRLQFKSFCSQLRDGRSAAEALWLVYRYHGVADFESRWRAWLAHPSHSRRVEELPDSERDHGDGVINKAPSWRSTIDVFGDFQPLNMHRPASSPSYPSLRDKSN